MELKFQDLYCKIFQSTQVAIAVTDLNGRYVLVNNAWCDFMGFTPEQSQSLHVNDITTHSDIPESDTNFRKLITGEIDSLYKRRKYISSDGKELWADLYATPLKDSEGEISGVLGVFINVTKEVKMNQRNADMQEVMENLNHDLISSNFLISKQQVELQEAYAKMEALARRDALTGLFNRRVLNEILDQEILRSNRIKQHCAVAIADIDNFKHINDTYGHDCGDMVLKKLAKVFTTKIRTTDIVGRWGGEEFLFILPDTDYKGALTVLERVLTGVRKLRCKYQEHNISLSITIGMSFHFPKMTKEVFLVNADKALYIGKNSGKNQIVCSDSCSSEILEKRKR